MKTGKVFLGILAGVAAGAAVGILFAPDKGSKTRNNITSRSRRFADDVGHAFSPSPEQASSQGYALAGKPGKFPENGNLKAEAAQTGVRSSL